MHKSVRCAIRTRLLSYLLFMWGLRKRPGTTAAETMSQESPPTPTMSPAKKQAAIPPSPTKEEVDAECDSLVQKMNEVDSDFVPWMLARRNVNHLLVLSSASGHLGVDRGDTWSAHPEQLWQQFVEQKRAKLVAAAMRTIVVKQHMQKMEESVKAAKDAFRLATATYEEYHSNQEKIRVGYGGGQQPIDEPPGPPLVLVLYADLQRMLDEQPLLHTQLQNEADEWLRTSRNTRGEWPEKYYKQPPKFVVVNAAGPYTKTEHGVAVQTKVAWVKVTAEMLALDKEKA